VNAPNQPASKKHGKVRPPVVRNDTGHRFGGIKTKRKSTMKTMLSRRISLLAAISTVFLTGLAAAQSTGSTGGPSAAEQTPPGASRPPEKEAIDACVGKTAGDRVRFTTSKGKSRKWTCVDVNGTLAARSGIATPARPKK
jgi:hypothetical protein